MTNGLLLRICKTGRITQVTVNSVSILAVICFKTRLLILPTGVLQDPSIDNKRLLLTPQSGATSGISATATPSSNDTIHVGAQSDDVCEMKKPCVNGGKCSNKDFQDYECDCDGLEFEGRNCQKRNPCGRVTDICAADMECVGVDTDGDADNGDEGHYCEWG